MNIRKPKHLGWIITGLIVAVLIGLSLLPKPTVVETISVRRGLLRQTVDAESRIRFKHRHLIAMPVNGTVAQILLAPGDSVKRGQVITYYVPPALDARQRSEAAARYDAARSAEREARQALAAIQPTLEQARRRAERTQRLFASGAISKEEAELASDAYNRLRAEFEAAESRVHVAAYTANAAKAATAAEPGQRIDVVSPVSGIVLRRFEEFERPLAAGSLLMEIGTSTTTEVVIDVLSTDAVRIKRGMKVLLDGWGTDDTLVAVVKTIEPAARIKVSALGVEEKRVEVIADVQHPPIGLGDGYKADAHVVLYENTNATVIPLGALAKENGLWYVFVVQNDVVAKRNVTLGRRSAMNVEVVSGLREGERVVLHPPEDLADGGLIETTADE